eukprot:c25988_g1_i1 orf=158-3031(+)
MGYRFRLYLLRNAVLKCPFRMGRYAGQSRRLLKTSALHLHQVNAEEANTSRLYPARGEVFEEKAHVGPHVVTFETGKLARFASGAVVLGIKETKVLATVVSENKVNDGKDFLPLQVDYREKQYAQGKIPNTFMRREGAPKERELLVGRLIDRSVRCLFPKGFFCETQIIGSVLCSDGQQDPDVMSANAASAALTISDIPWNGPVGVVRIGRVNGCFVVNPDMDELSESDLNLVYACTADKTVMIETQAREISNNDLKAAFYLAHEEAQKLIPPQLRLASKVQNKKRSFESKTASKDILEKLRSIAEDQIEAVMGDPSYGKFERGKALSKVQDELSIKLKAEGDTDCLEVLPMAFDEVRKQVVRRNIFQKGLRVDGRQADEVRELYCEAGLFPTLHGSSLFSRGNTQVVCTVTLGAPEDAQRLDSLVGPPTKRFMVHYSFPPFCINEIGRSGGLNRREVGHGTLAEKALLALLPPEDDFPYSVRVTSECLASDGSSSMASVCGGSIALMDAGVPLREHVAGVSVGLVSEVDMSTGRITDYRLLTDILGLEDHLGDMDFKIAGTKNGITAIQLDIKPAGIPLEILCEGLEPALAARKHILDFMEQEISGPRDEQKLNTPRTGTVTVQRESIGRLIGPLGSTVKNIQRVTGARVQVFENGTVNIFARDQAAYEQAIEMVESTIGKEIEVGNVYNGVVIAIKDFGAFVELDGGHQGLLHISEIAHQKTLRVTDAIAMGQQIKVMCIGRDVRGNLKLSLKATIPRLSSEDISTSRSVSVSVEEGQDVNLVTSVAGTGVSIISTASKQTEEIVSTLEQKDQGSLPSAAQHMKDASLKLAAGSKSVDKCSNAMQVEPQHESAELKLHSEVRDNKESVKKCDKSQTVEVGAAYLVTVYETRDRGAILITNDGVLGKLFYDKELKHPKLHVGDRIHVKCERIDGNGRPVFIMLNCKHSSNNFGLDV